MRSKVSLLSLNIDTTEELDASTRAIACSSGSPRSRPVSFTASPVVAVGNKNRKCYKTSQGLERYKKDSKDEQLT